MAYERLTGKSECGYNNLDACLNCDLEMDCGLCPYWAKALDRLAELEDKIEQGLMIELPCKIGDTVYEIETSVREDDRLVYSICETLFSFECLEGWGDWYFLTIEEAEKKIKELQGDKE